MSDERLPLTQEESQEIKKKYPSICFGCENSRRPAADANTLKGWVGCTLNAIDGKGLHNIDIADEVGESWVDLKAHVHGKGSGVITNMMLVTRGVKKCTEYKSENI